MKQAISLLLLLALLIPAVTVAQTTPQQQQQDEPDDVVRISTQLVQTDVVVLDKNDQIVTDLKLEDFEVYDNGKKQDLRFMEFVSVDAGRRTEGKRPEALIASEEVARQMGASDVRRVIAFLVDDLTIPFADLAAVRQAISDFVENQMRDGDLVAIIRTVGGKGLLQQFTSDRRLLRRAIAQLNVSTSPFSGVNNPDFEKFQRNPAAGAGTETEESARELGGGTLEDIGSQNIESTSDETMRYFRGMLALSTADNIIESLRTVPGRKSMILFSSGIPIFDVSSTGAVYATTTELLRRVSDHAVRAGVVINTINPTSLRTGGVGGFVDMPTKSGLSAETPGFGRTGADIGGFNKPFGSGEQNLGLSSLANATGGISVTNRNDLKAGVEKVMARSRGYYVLAYTPSESFDNKFHKLDIRVKRQGLRVFKHAGYLAREDRRAVPNTKEEQIAAAVRSPLAKRDVDVSATLSLRHAPAGKAELGINALIDASKLKFKEEAGKYQTSYDVAGFIYDEVGKLRGGFSETINTTLTPDEYRNALKTGIPYYANTQLPPGYYQLRLAVREVETGNLGTLSRYVEVPDLSKGRFSMSSVFLHAVNPQNPTQPIPLLALRHLKRNQDLRYSAIIYNAKMDAGKSQLRSQVIISQGTNVLFREPEQPVVMQGADATQLVKIGQIGLSKVQPGRYVLTMIVTDPLAPKGNQTLSRSIDFIVTN